MVVNKSELIEGKEWKTKLLMANGRREIQYSFESISEVLFVLISPQLAFIH